MVRPHPIRVAIDGVDAAGKTTLADEIALAISSFGRLVIRASIDGFHNPARIRRQRGALSPGGISSTRSTTRRCALRCSNPLGPGGSLEFRRAVFDFRIDQPVEAAVEHAAPDAVLLFDGVFLLRHELRECFEFSIFVHADFAVTLARAELRDRGLFGTREDIPAALSGALHPRTAPVSQPRATRAPGVRRRRQQRPPPAVD